MSGRLERMFREGDRDHDNDKDLDQDKDVPTGRTTDNDNIVVK